MWLAIKEVSNKPSIITNNIISLYNEWNKTIIDSFGIGCKMNNFL